MKSELHQKQIIIEKLLDINKNQIKNNCPSNGINQSDKRLSEKSSSSKTFHFFSFLFISTISNKYNTNVIVLTN